ncbi:ER membrane protein complex subunit 8/9 [Cryptosporidium felis]|nr:ER membrane protein complex subunit 8/9 [Cryptosporidium felis]
MKVKFNEKSYMKIALHSIKYPLCDLDGLLLGYTENGNICVIDAFPLTHGLKLPLLATLGLQYAQEYCNILNNSLSDVKLDIIGYYTGFFTGNVPDTLETRGYFEAISKKLVLNNKNSIGLFLSQGTSFMEGLVIRLLSNKEILSHSIQDDLKIQCLNQEIRDMKYRGLSDFEDHISNPKLRIPNTV